MGGLIFQDKNLFISSLQHSNDESWYKATRAQRAWFASGCTTVLISVAKSILIITRMPNTSRTLLHTTLAALVGYVLADLASGVYHWTVDNYGSAQTPIFGSHIESFRAHHQQPWAITKCEAASILYILAGVVTVAVLPINIVCNDPTVLGFVGAFAGFGMFSLQFHAWSHTSKGKLPPLVAALQGAGIILRWSQHAAHHRPPYNSNYCTVSGVWNWVLDKSHVFVAVEVLLFRMLGVRPRSWADPKPDWVETTQMKPVLNQGYQTLGC
ncbi:hypothetical protein Pfo_013610 [Paulownia fortunei]|nr:hypothetical protein Pfo_013610 [Paulownia fortunei]